MENVRKGRIAVFTKKYLTKLLLAAVILTAGFSLRFVALAKYTSYLYDFTGAVASDFCFTSNYLDESGTRLYPIGKWDGSDYSLDLELRNYENALRYNGADVDTCYYLDVDVTYDDGANQWKKDEQAQVTFSYKEGSDYTIGTYKDGGVDKTCLLLPGMEDNKNDFEFKRQNGTQNIRIEIKTFSNKEKNHQITVTARTVPAALKKNLVTTDDSPGALKAYTGYGVYDVELKGVFQLNKAEITPQVTPNCMRPDPKSREMFYTLTCTSLSSGTTIVRIYYKTEVIEPDSTMILKARNIGSGTGEYEGYDYFDIEVQSNCITRCSLFSKDTAYDAGTAIANGDIRYVVDPNKQTQPDGPGGEQKDPDAGGEDNENNNP